MKINTPRQNPHFNSGPVWLNLSPIKGFKYNTATFEVRVERVGSNQPPTRRASFYMQGGKPRNLWDAVKKKPGTYRITARSMATNLQK